MVKYRLQRGSTSCPDIEMCEFLLDLNFKRQYRCQITWYAYIA